MKFIRLSQDRDSVRVNPEQVAATRPYGGSGSVIVLFGGASFIVDQSPETVSMLIDLAVRGEAHEDIIAEPSRMWVEP